LNQVEFEVAFNHFPADATDETGTSKDIALGSIAVELGFNSTLMTLETTTCVACADVIRTLDEPICSAVAFKADGEAVFESSAVSNEALPATEAVAFVNTAEALCFDSTVRIGIAIATELVAFLNGDALATLSPVLFEAIVNHFALVTIGMAVLISVTTIASL